MRGAGFSRILVVIAVTLAGCSKATDSASGGDSTVPNSASVGEAAAPTASAAPSAEAGLPEAWSGHYAASPGSISIPDAAEWGGVKFRGDDAGIGLGDGPFSFSVDAGGHVRGALEGPLGPLRVTGELSEKRFAAALVSNEPGRGFSGTATGVLNGDQISGTMRLSLPTANVVREASFTLERKR